MTIEHLSSLGLIKVSGQDAAQFLQGQLTNDIEQLGDCWQYSGLCSPKGRLLAVLQIWQQDTDFYALLADDLVEAVIKRLRMYVLRSKVTITQDLGFSILGVFNQIDLSALDHEVAEGLLNLESRPNLMLNNQTTTILSMHNRYLVLDSKENSNKSSKNAVKQSVWLKSNITDGVPEVRSSSSELFIPQMINLDLVDGISFNKGCYTGQEIIARMHYLGKLKQRMFVCDLANSNMQAPEPGDKVFIDSQATKGVGHIVSATPDFDKILAVIRLQNKHDRLFLSNGASLTIDPVQPYPVE